MTSLLARSETVDFNFDWRFSLTDDPEAREPAFDDSAWQQLRLPHDWSVAFSFDPVDGEGATGYLPGGIGWYRKRFVCNTDNDQLVFLLFDGIYNNSEVWLNGRPLGGNPYGYSPFWFDITPFLKPGDVEQVLAVRVDHSRYVDSRWYTGSGIYRDVQLITKSRLHIPIWGTYLTTPHTTETGATVALDVVVRNEFSEVKTGRVRTRIVDPDDHVVDTIVTPFTLAAGETTTCQQTASIPTLALWHPDQPHLYRAVSYLESDDILHEVYETPFGVRSFVFDPDEGFFLNGENMSIKGVCLHHDAGLVGAAVPDGVWRRRLTLLKELGCNAIRTAHNPSSAVFLDMCDEMGFLVQVEFFDEWDFPKDKRLNQGERHGDEPSRGYAEYFQEWAESDLKRTMLRDRNHPYVFQWSIGNEIEWTFPRYEQATGYFDANSDGNYFWTIPPFSGEEIKKRFEALPAGEYVLAETAHKLAGWVREMDQTRPVTANCILPSASHVTGYADALDVVGYSYRQVIYDLGHAHYPDKVIMGAENLGQWHEWMHVIERPFISGLFIWTGINYLGEAAGKWPQKGSASGLIDLAGFPRASYYMWQSLWREEPVLHLTTQTLEKSPYQVGAGGKVEEREPGSWRRRLWGWHDVNAHWNYGPGVETAVEVYANCAEVELFHNGRSLGRGRLADQEDRIFKWTVPFAAGMLTARGIHESGISVETQLVTAGAPVAIQLETDITALRGNGYDVTHVVAQLVDAQGVPVRHLEREISFDVTGPCRSLGVDNGRVDSVQDYQSDRLTTAQGRALLILQAERTVGRITVMATSGDLACSELQIEVKGLSG